MSTVTHETDNPPVEPCRRPRLTRRKPTSVVPEAAIAARMAENVTS